MILDHLLHALTPNSRHSLPFTTISLALLSCLRPTNALEQHEKRAADYYVRSLPGAPDGPLLKMHAGHIEVSPETHGSLFFWHYQNRHIENRQRTVIWLNGGPGCSSMDGNLMEIGPYRVGEGGKLHYNNGSWDAFANLLFVDNPVGTGFSFVDSNSYLHELKEMADQFVIFLEAFFVLFPEYQRDDLYIAGESYAGQHIPYISRAILDRNAKYPNAPTYKWNLKGLLIGNGWISDEYQSPVNLQFALDNNLIKPGSRKEKTIRTQQKRCEKRLAEGDADHVDTRECEAILQDILRETQDLNAPEDSRCINMYDITLRDSFPSCGMNWPPDLANVTPYLRKTEVINALHIDRSKKSAGWSECNGQVSEAFQARNSKPSFDLLPGLLEQVPIILFSGANDLICNHVGTENLIAHLDWNGGTGFADSTPTRQWTFEGKTAGTYRADRNLTYILFDDSSHMVPFDYPKRSRDMLDRFMGIEPSRRFPDSRIEGEASNLPISQTPASGATSPAASAVVDVPDADDMTDEEAAIAQQARWDAYYRSGEVALVLVIIMAAVWGWWVWRDRRRRAGYKGLDGTQSPIMDGVRDIGGGALRMEAFRHKPERDLEGGGLSDGEDGGGKKYADEQYVNGNGVGHATSGVSAEQARRYSLGSLSDASDDEDEKKISGR